MAKKIEYAPGFPMLRGNISGHQKLEYAENDNPAYNSPVGSRNYARNYRASIIVNKRASSGAYYYGVKTKSAIGMTTRSKNMMALMGGAGAIYSMLVKNPTFKAAMVSIWEHDRQYSTYADYTFRKYWIETIRSLLRNRQDRYNRIVTASLTFYNPWVYRDSITYSISMEIIAKFWTMLADNPITYTVEGALGVAHTGDTWHEVIDECYNVFGMRAVAGDRLVYVVRDNMYLQLDGGIYVDADDEVINGGSYYWTSEPGE